MVLKGIVVSAAFGAALLLAGGGATAAQAQYRPDDFLSLDLSRAVLSPTPLGPPTEFAKVPVEASSDHANEAAWARKSLNTEPRKVVVETVKAPRAHVARVAADHVTHRQAARAHVAHVAKHRARTRLAHRYRYGNPMDAEAMDTRIQVWPCRTGGICNWKR